MKLTIIGGAGARVPLVTNGLLRFHNDLVTDELALFDIDEDRSRVVADISAAMAKRFQTPLRITRHSSLESALEGATFVLSSIRVGGTPGRILDETIALENGTLGQETVGAGGFSLALRTIRPMVEYAEKVADLAPDAWLINFTNPVGIISQAMLEAGVGDRCIGVCDTPREQFDHLAKALDFPLEGGHFDYLGLNHLGWIRSILVNGEDRIGDLLRSDANLEKVYKIPFFEKGFLRELGLFPTEYLYFYYSPRQAYRATLASGSTRGQLVQKLERDMMKLVTEAGNDVDAVLLAYDRYLAARNATYMAVETGGVVGDGQIAEARDELYQSAAGYEKIAIDVMRAIRQNRPTVIPLDVANRGSILDLDTLDAVEVSCLVDANGAHPLATGSLPDPVRGLVNQVKEYERLTVKASLQGSADLAVEALMANPIIQGRSQAQMIVDSYRKAHSPHLDYLV